MTLHERIELEITGDATEKESRKALLQIVVDAFAKGGQELVTVELAAAMQEIEERVDSELSKLEAKF